MALAACEMQELNINDILDYAKCIKHTPVLNLEGINVNEPLAQVHSYFIEQAKEAGINLNLLLQSQTPFILADRNRMKQVLFNLCSSALKFTPNGSITSKQSIEFSKNLHNRAIIYIIDIGVGIKQENLKTLFTAFGMLDSTRNINKSGSGLGLFLCKTYVI